MSGGVGVVAVFVAVVAAVVADVAESVTKGELLVETAVDVVATILLELAMGTVTPLAKATGRLLKIAESLSLFLSMFAMLPDTAMEPTKAEGWCSDKEVEVRSPDPEADEDPLGCFTISTEEVSR